MTPRALAFALACALALPAGAQLRVSPSLGAPRLGESTQPRAADFIVAVVNSEPITNHEVRTRLLRFEQQLAQQGAAVPPRAELTQIVLERLISEKAQLQYAREIGLKVDDAMVDQAEQNVARQNGMDAAQLRRRLESEGIPPSVFREDLRNQLLLSRVRDREVEQRVRVTDVDVEQFLREQAAADPSAVELNLAQVLVALPDQPTEEQVREARAKADRALQRARGGEDFGRIVRELSDAPGARSGSGELGLRPLDRLPPAFVEAARSLPAGGVSEVIRSPAGFHVLKVVERREGGLPTAVTQHHARHILLRPSARLPEAAARERLAEFKRRIEAGQADFAQLAREHSQDASARNGGDLGWANPGLFVPEFEEVLVSLQPGQIAEPVVSRFGVHLVQLLERRTHRLTPREQREIARNLVREKKLDEAYAQWAQEVRGRAYVELREPPQ